jgi:hypothetical protein
MQQKNNRKAKQTNPHPNNTMPTCYGTINSSHTDAVRGKLEGPRGARGNTRTCLDPTPPTLDTTREITTYSVTDTWRPNRTPHRKIKAGISKIREATGSTYVVRGKQRGIWTERHNTRTYPDPPPLSPNITHRSSPQTPSPTYPRCPTLRSYSVKKKCIEPQTQLRKPERGHALDLRGPLSSHGSSPPPHRGRLLASSSRPR